MRTRHRSTSRSALLPLALLAVLSAAGAASMRQPPPPADGPLSHLRVPDGFVVEQVAGPDLLSYPMFATLAGEGRLFVFESTAPNTMTTEEMLAAPSYHVRLLEDVDGDGVYDRSHLFAEHIPFPMGGALYDGSLYVAAAPDLLRFTDTTGDGRADQREVVLTGWKLNVNGAAMGGPYLGPDGWLYITDARRGFEITRKEGDVLTGTGARIWRVRPDGTGLEWIAAGGFDNAVEIAFMPSGETIGTMTYFVEPQHGLRDALMHWVEGGIYPKPNPVIANDRLPLTGPLLPPMTTLARVAPSGLMRYRSSAFGPEFQGNLFSAQFNTGRVMRHVVTAEGATYRTEDTPFFTSSHADAHPTDVLEDADGSLLVLDTGGWFIKGCPLSRVAKPDVEGGIYRIRRADAPRPADPWGRSLRIGSLPPERAVTHLTDTRPMVVDAAIERLVATGPAAVPALAASLRDMPDEAARTSAVFALYRIGTPDARRAVRGALDDGSALVRTAAARAAGLARDTDAQAALMTMVGRDVPAVRRQAATALGQIGQRDAVSALLTSAADVPDRFVEHAIIHALITLRDGPALLTALTHAAPGVRTAALIALDQFDGSPLRREHLAPFLESDVMTLRDAGLWVLSHRPAWGDLVVDTVARYLDRPDMPEAEAAAARDLTTTFCRDEPVQALVARRAGAAGSDDALRLLLLDVMSACPVESLPAAWTAEAGRLLRSGSPPVRDRVLRLAETRGISALEPDVTRLVHDPATPMTVRLDALGARVRTSPALSEAEFALLTSQFDAGVDAPIRQRAARVLGSATLTEAQRLVVATEYVATADAFLLPRLLDPFASGTSLPVGMALVRGLLASSERLDNLSGEDLRQLFSTYPEEVQAAAAPVMTALAARHADRLDRLEALDRQLSRGNIDAGRQLFFGKSICSTCHAVGTEGGTFGPDLTTIGDIRSRHDILEAILFPSASLAREYETYRVVAASGTHIGIVKEQGPDEIVLDTGPGTHVRLRRAEVTAMEPLNVSTMPPGLEHLLETEELSDLVAFLQSLPDPVDRPSRR